MPLIKTVKVLRKGIETTINAGDQRSDDKLVEDMNGKVVGKVPKAKAPKEEKPKTEDSDVEEDDNKEEKTNGKKQKTARRT